MLHLTTSPLRSSVNSGEPANGYFLSDVSLEIPSPNTAIFQAKLNGPAGAEVWARAWLSNEMDGTLAEAASPGLTAGDVVTLTVVRRDARIPENAFIRIQSSPLATEQVVLIKLPRD